MDENFATKNDLASFKSEMKIEFLSVRHEMKEMESRMIIKLGGVMIAGVTIILAAMPFLKI